ncbi:ABC transporter ATP-binding protein [Nocardioides litoris]|uniref:ABC transporter ATP-binding protein n=1 Tax=Nocardioides litoris TaxID=1926648 RepID=UPI00111E7A30|nr:ABC transporter ATP-binding protein [Nocardioides litoris]
MSTARRPGTARRLLGLLLHSRWRTLGVVVLTAVAVSLTVAGPLLVGRAVDTVVDGVRGEGLDTGALATAVLLVVVVGAGAALGELAQGWLLNGAATAAARRLRRDVEGKLHRLPIAHVDTVPRGELLSKVTNDVDNVARTLGQTLGQLLTALLTVVAVLATMLTISPLLTLVALVLVPVTALVTRVLVRRSQPHFVRQWTATGELNAQVEEAFSGHDLLTAFGRHDEARARFAATNDELARVGHRAQFLSGLLNPVMVLLGNLSFVSICVVGAWRVVQGQLTIGGVVAFVQYSQQLTAPLSQVGTMVTTLQSGLASAERVFALLDEDEEPAEATGRLPVPTRGRLVFESVTFDYGAGPLIEDLDLVVEPGRTVAVVGPTGAGKTTLVNLLARFYDPRSGRITLDGTDIAAVPRAELRSRVAMVLQDTWLLAGTIADNIAFGRAGAEPADVRRAAAAASVDHVVRALPDGYDTLVDDTGHLLSAGERQLVTIARAFVADPAVLVLDEATSAVDTRTELLVQRAMDALRADRTVVVIAHRLATVRTADLVLVMEAGRIVERGTHDDLLAADGAYARLHRAQADRETDGEGVPIGA